MTLIMELLQTAMQEYNNNRHMPEVRLLWACYERALRDLELNSIADIAILSDAVAWFKAADDSRIDRITWDCVMSHCMPSARIIRTTRQMVADAEYRLYALCRERNASLRPKVQAAR